MYKQDLKCHLFSCSCRDARKVFFFFNETAPPEISPLSLHDALPISIEIFGGFQSRGCAASVRCDEHQPVHAVRAVLPVFAVENRDPLAVRTPFRTRTSSARSRRRQLFLSRAGCCVD